MNTFTLELVLGNRDWSGALSAGAGLEDGVESATLLPLPIGVKRIYRNAVTFVIIRHDRSVRNLYLLNI